MSRRDVRGNMVSVSNFIGYIMSKVSFLSSTRFIIFEVSDPAPFVLIFFSCFTFLLFLGVPALKNFFSSPWKLIVAPFPNCNPKFKCYGNFNLYFTIGRYASTVDLIFKSFGMYLASSEASKISLSSYFNLYSAALC